MEELRSWWEVASIAHFCSLFRDPFKLVEFDVDELEEALVCCTSALDEDSLVIDLLQRLLKGCYPRHDVTKEAHMDYLRRLVTKWNKSLPLGSRMTRMPDETHFSMMSLRQRVELLHLVCECRVCASDVMDKVKDYEGEDMRIESIGYDASGATYWYFNDTRLYKEDAEKTEKSTKRKHAKRRSSKHRSSSKKRLRGRKKQGASDNHCDGNESTEMKIGQDQSNESQSVTDCDSGLQADSLHNENASADEVATVNTRWHIVCETLQQWQQLADTFRHSETTCERELAETIDDILLPELPAIFHGKEQRLHKKLLEFAPRRVSDRSTKGKRRKCDEDNETSVSVPSAVHGTEAEMTTEQLTRNRSLERQKASEDRSKRAQLREMRMLMNGDLPDEFKVTSLPERKSENEALRNAMLKVLKLVRNRRESWPFLEPVDEAYAPKYYDIIAKPMDLSTIERKLKTEGYASRDDFSNDIDLIFDNCLKYNGFASEYTNLAQKMVTFFQNAMKKHLPVVDDNADTKKQGVGNVSSPHWTENNSPVGSTLSQQSRDRGVTMGGSLPSCSNHWTKVMTSSSSVLKTAPVEASVSKWGGDGGGGRQYSGVVGVTSPSRWISSSSSSSSVATTTASTVIRLMSPSADRTTVWHQSIQRALPTISAATTGHHHSPIRPMSYLKSTVTSHRVDQRPKESASADQVGSARLSTHPVISHSAGSLNKMELDKTRRLPNGLNTATVCTVRTDHSKHNLNARVPTSVVVISTKPTASAVGSMPNGATYWTSAKLAVSDVRISCTGTLPATQTVGRATVAATTTHEVVASKPWTTHEVVTSKPWTTQEVATSRTAQNATDKSWFVKQMPRTIILPPTWTAKPQHSTQNKFPSEPSDSVS